jgi:hypothetical protein
VIHEVNKHALCLCSLALMDGRGIDSLTCQAMQTTTFAHASRFAPSILSFRRHHLRTCIHPPPPNNFHHWPCNRTGVTLSPHLSLRAPPIPAHSRRRFDTAPAHKEGLEAPHRLKGHTGTRLWQPWSPKEKPPILSVSTMRDNPLDYAIATAITRARAPTNRSSNVFFNSASTSATSRAMVRFYELFRYGFRSSTSPALATIAHDRTRWRCMPRKSWTWIWLASLLAIPSPPISAHRRLVSV